MSIEIDKPSEYPYVGNAWRVIIDRSSIDIYVSVLMLYDGRRERKFLALSANN